MRVMVCADARKASALSQALPQADVLSVEEFPADITDVQAVLSPLTSNIEILRRLDMRDGLAKVVGAIDTIALQPTGSSRMNIGFTTTSGAIARALGMEMDTSFANCAILGASELASAALAAAVQLHAAHIVLVAPRSIGPGSAIAASHRMGLTVPLVKPAQADLSRADLVIVTDEIAAATLAQISPEATVIDVVDAAPSLKLVVAKYVSRREIDIVQLGDQIRLITSVQPDLATLERIYPDAPVCG